jgi:NUC194 domain
MQTKFSGDYQKGEMPKWMAELHAKMSPKEAPPNVSLFIAKIVCNRPAVCKKTVRIEIIITSVDL